jgi:hypothetical protein
MRTKPLLTAEELYRFSAEFEQKIVIGMERSVEQKTKKLSNLYCFHDETNVWQVQLSAQEWGQIRVPGFQFNLMSSQDLVVIGYETQQLIEQSKGQHHPSLQIRRLEHTTDGPEYIAKRGPSSKEKIKNASSGTSKQGKTAV